MMSGTRCSGSSSRAPMQYQRAMSSASAMSSFFPTPSRAAFPRSGSTYVTAWARETTAALRTLYSLEEMW